MVLPGLTVFIVLRLLEELKDTSLTSNVVKVPGIDIVVSAITSPQSGKLPMPAFKASPQCFEEKG